MPTQCSQKTAARVAIYPKGIWSGKCLKIISISHLRNKKIGTRLSGITWGTMSSEWRNSVISILLWVTKLRLTEIRVDTFMLIHRSNFKLFKFPKTHKVNVNVLCKCSIYLCKSWPDPSFLNSCIQKNIVDTSWKIFLYLFQSHQQKWFIVFLHIFKESYYKRRPNNLGFKVFKIFAGTLSHLLYC